MSVVSIEGIMAFEASNRKKAHRQNAMRSQLLLRALHTHHDYRMSIPEGWAPEVPAEPSPEFKELWFHIEEELSPPPPPMIEDVKRIVCEYFGITHTNLLSRRRDHATVRPRHIAIYLAKKFTGRSYPEIARRIGQFDHTSAIFAFRRIERLCLSDASIAHDVAHLEVRLGQ